MRKIKHPQITVKAREVFYFMKRRGTLGGLDEEAIEEILEREKPAALIDSACLYEPLNRKDFTVEETQAAGNLFLGRGGAIAAVAVATIGDRGLEARLTRGSSPASDAPRAILDAWSQVFLQKLVDFVEGLMRREAGTESLELGDARNLDLNEDGSGAAGLWKRLDPEQKIGTRIESDPLNGLNRLRPRLTRFWTVPWLTRKEKKQMGQQAVAALK